MAMHIPLLLLCVLCILSFYQTNLIASGGLVEHNTLELGLEPLDGIILGDAVSHANTGLTRAALGNAISRAVENDVEIHAVNTGRGIVLNAEINVFVDAKAKVAGGREVSAQ